MTPAHHAVQFAVLATEKIDPEGNQAIGWLAGIFTLVLFIVVGLLLWSFRTMAQRARQPWPDEDAQHTVSIDRDEPPTS